MAEAAFDLDASGEIPCRPIDDDSDSDSDSDSVDSVSSSSDDDDDDASLGSVASDVDEIDIDEFGLPHSDVTHHRLDMHALSITLTGTIEAIRRRRRIFDEHARAPTDFFARALEREGKWTPPSKTRSPTRSRTMSPEVEQRLLTLLDKEQRRGGASASVSAWSTPTSTPLSFVSASDAARIRRAAETVGAFEDARRSSPSPSPPPSMSAEVGERLVDLLELEVAAREGAATPTSPARR